MTPRYPTRVGLLTAITIALVAPISIEAQWSAHPGESVRDGFGPQRSGYVG